MSNQGQNNRNMRRAIAESTLKVIKKSGYADVNDEWVAFDRTISRAESTDAEDQKEEIIILDKEPDFYPEGCSFNYDKAADSSGTEKKNSTSDIPPTITVTTETTMGAASRAYKRGALPSHEEGSNNLHPPRVGILNFASAKNPGGGFLKGSQAQEEVLARSSDLYPSLCKMKAQFYGNVSSTGKGGFRSVGKFYTDHIIYSPNVCFFKNDIGEILTCQDVYFCDVISCAAVNRNAVMDSSIGRRTSNLDANESGRIVDQKEKTMRNNQEHDKNDETIAEIMKRRIRRVLQCAIENVIEILVLGAWGTGVFRNDAGDVAEWFQEEIQSLLLNDETRVRGKSLRAIIFAVPGQNTAEIFSRTFKVEVMEY